jgi:UDP-glucuronate decarboxylase
MRSLATKVLEQTGSRSSIELRPLPEDDPRQRQPDITRALEILHWQPTTDVAEGLKRTISYFRNMMDQGLIESA